LSEVAGRADRNDDVVECGSVGRRIVCVRALALLDHVALVASLLTRLHKVVPHMYSCCVTVRERRTLLRCWCLQWS